MRRTSGTVPNGWLFPLVPYALVNLFCEFAGGRPPGWLTWTLFLAFALRILLEVRWRIGEAVALRTMRSDRAFSDAPPGMVEYPTEIVLYNEGRDIGADRGIVWFDEGLIRFNGAACSFALSAADFYARTSHDGRDFYAGLPGDVFRFKTYGRAATVRFLPIGGNRRWGLHRRLGMFLGKGEATDAPRQWPPLVPYGLTPKAFESGADS